MAVHMSDDQVSSLIEQIRDFPCIWDTKCPDYTDREKARLAWLEIARTFGSGITDDDLKKKYKSLRTQFSQKLADYHLSMKKKRWSEDQVKRPVWKFFDHLQFLLPHVSRRGKDGSLTKVDEDIPSSEYSFGDRIAVHYSHEGLDDRVASRDGKYWNIIPLKLEVDEAVDEAYEEEDEHDAELQVGFQVDNDRHLPSGATSERSGSVTPPVQNTTNLPSFQPPSSPAFVPPSPNPNSTPPVLARRVTNLPVAASPVHHPSSSVAPKSGQKRKFDALDEAVSALQTLIKVQEEKHQKVTEAETPKTENDVFLELLAMKMSKLPEDVQDGLRLEFLQRVVQETKKARVGQKSGV